MDKLLNIQNNEKVNRGDSLSCPLTRFQPALLDRAAKGG